MKLRHGAQPYSYHPGKLQRDGHNEAGPIETNGYGSSNTIYWWLGGEKILHQEKSE